MTVYRIYEGYGLYYYSLAGVPSFAAPYTVFWVTLYLFMCHLYPRPSKIGSPYYYYFGPPKLVLIYVSFLHTPIFPKFTSLSLGQKSDFSPNLPDPRKLIHLITFTSTLQNCSRYISFYIISHFPFPTLNFHS